MIGVRLLTDAFANKMRKKSACVMAALLLCKKQVYWIEQMRSICIKGIRFPQYLTDDEISIINLLYMFIERQGNITNCLNISNSGDNECSSCGKIFRAIMYGNQVNNQQSKNKTQKMKLNWGDQKK
jgi:hypothetical protein